MRAAAILGLGSSVADLKPFQKEPATKWSMGLPASADEADVILIFGGDGTVHRHLSQLVALQRPVLVVPRGSGNDFARALGLGRVRDAVSAWQRFLGRNEGIRKIDLGTITALGEQRSVATRYFCCVGGCGIDAEAGRRANAMPAWLRAHGGYIVALAGALAGFRPVAMKIESVGAASPEIKSREVMLLAFANAPSYGGGMRIAPRARLDDGKLDFCLVNRLGKLRLTCLFPTVYFGHHLNISEVEYFQASRLRLETENPIDVYADGEYVCRTPIEVGIAAKALPVIAP